MRDSTQSVYELFYWPGLQGRGEFVRLCLEDAAALYIDLARSPAHGGVDGLLRVMREHDGDGPAPLAPPFLRHESLVIAQVANILHYLGPRLGLAPDDERARHYALQLQLTVADLVAEVHDTHHPISTGLYYEQQKPEALRRTEAFVEQRLPKFLRYFERQIARAGGAFALGPACSYVDLSLFQAVEGLRYAFATAMRAIEPELPALVAVHDRVAARPNIEAYLRSSRRIPFNEHGIFRRYPELDLAPSWAKPT